jgi:hypothetical protein
VAVAVVLARLEPLRLEAVVPVVEPKLSQVIQAEQGLLIKEITAARETKVATFPRLSTLAVAVELARLERVLAVTA